jgi:hypothetical protein
MYNVLWSGSYLPLPGGSHEVPQRSNGWQPLFSSENGIPFFWWFLVDHFNCFWREAGAPVFLVDRESALARCDSRFSLLKEVFSEPQQRAWRHFRDAIATSRGEIFNVELSEVWQNCAGVERFQTYTNDCLLPFEISSSRWRRQSIEQKKQSCATLVAESDNLTMTLFGQAIDPNRIGSLGPDAAP